MDFILFGTLLLMVNVVISVLIALVIIHELYISKKFSKQNNFHFYNDLFSWEIFFLLITIENLMKILSDFLPINYEIYDLLLKIRILLLFFPFWNKIIHLERIMNKITYKRHYFVGIIPSIIVLILSFTGLPNIILIWILLSSSLVPYLILLIFLRNYGTSKIKSFKIILGVVFVGLGCIFKPEILLLEMFNIISPILLILGSIVILDSFRKEIIV